MEQLLLTTSQVAELLRLHPSTVKRWSDQGILSSEKTQGGHRRYHLKDVLHCSQQKGIITFLDPFHPWEANVWLAVQAGARDGDFGRLTHLALTWLREGQTDLLGRLFFEIGSRPEIPFTEYLDRAVSGFMVQVGEEWLQGRLQVGEEHMASEVILESLIRLRLAREPRGRPPLVAAEPAPVAVVGSLEGEFHAIGAQAVRSILERRGWRVYYLGSNVPAKEFSSIQQAQVADLVCISLSSRVTAPEVREAVETLAREGNPRYPHALALGGGFQGIGPDDLPRDSFSSLSLSHSVREFQEWLDVHYPESGT